MKLFDLGQVVLSRGIAEKVERDFPFFVFCNESVNRHEKGDWGKLPDEDKEANEEALRTGGRLFSAYEQGGVRIWIITEADRSFTTILFPDEY